MVRRVETTDETTCRVRATYKTQPRATPQPTDRSSRALTFPPTAKARTYQPSTPKTARDIVSCTQSTC